MFDRITKTPRKSSSRLAVLFSLSIGTHVAVALGLLIAGFWQIEKLMPPERRISLMPSGGPRAVEPSKPVEMERLKKPRVAKRPVKSLVQPDEQPPETETMTEIAAVEDTGESAGVGLGVGLGLGTGDGLQLGDSDGPVIPVVTLPAPPEPIEPPAPPVVRNIPPHLLDGTRIAGEEHILPPDSVRVAMHRQDERRLQGTIKMCLDREGRVSSLKVLRSTGYQAYDQKLLGTIRHWRYRPYRVDGQTVGVCTPIEYIYVVVD